MRSEQLAAEVCLAPVAAGGWPCKRSPYYHPPYSQRVCHRWCSTLEDLGPPPEAHATDALALWVAALINPIPPLNLAPEIRSAALCAASAEQRLGVAFEATERSIAFLRQSTR